MKMSLFTSGLVAITLACPWLICQESTAPASSGGAAVSPAPSGQTIIATTLSPLAVAPPNATQAPAVISANLPAAEAPVWNRGQNGQWFAQYRDVRVSEDLQAFNQAYQAYADAKDEAARNQAASELKIALEKRYDAFVEGQSRQITELEERLAKLKEQLEKRREAKDRMVELKLQMVLSQAEGLGFPDGGSPSGPIIFGEFFNPYQSSQGLSSVPLESRYPAPSLPAARAVNPAAPPAVPTVVPPQQLLPPASRDDN